MTAEISRIFQPVEIGNKTARNRVASTPHTTGFAEDGVPTDHYIRYHADKARGGAGLVMTFGSCSVHPTTPWDTEIAAFRDDVVPHLQRMSDEIHKHGALLISQIAHRGRRTTSLTTERPLLAPSALPDPDPAHREIPHEIEPHQIEELIESFAAAAARFKAGGFDGVEVNSIGGQLIEQFWSPQMNQRIDEWGGSLTNRMRFGVRVVEAVRERVGRDFIVGFRMTADEMLDEGLHGEDMQEIARRMNALGALDYFSLTAGFGMTLTTTAMSVPSMDFPATTYRDQVLAMRDSITAPVIYAGRVLTVQQGEQLLKDDVCDIVAMTRAMMADPEMVNKAQRGEHEDIRPCVGANEGCIGRRYQGLPLRCVHNPVIGHEDELGRIEPATEPGHVVVIGGGPAGMEAARVAAIRGHQVTLFERNEHLGGQIRTAARAPQRGDYIGVIRWLEGQVEKTGVDIRLGHSPDPAKIMALKPISVIVATGSQQVRPDWTGADLPNVHAARDVLNGDVGLKGTCVVVDEEGHMTGPTTADYLSQSGNKVYCVTRLPTFGEDIDPTLKPSLYQRLFQKGAEMLPHMRVSKIADSTVALENVYGSPSPRVLEGIDHVVYSVGSNAEDALYKELREQHPSVHLVGDAMAPRRLNDAMLEATRAGRVV